MPSTAPEPRRVALEEVAFRWSDYDVPLWARPNSRSLRWNRADQAPTQYTSMTTDGAWAELVRAEGLRTHDDLLLVSMPMWVLRISETAVADYSTFEKADVAGFPPEALVEEDYERCQREADRLRDLGYRGVLAPSAALPEDVNLTLFGPRLTVPWSFPDEKRLGSFVPAKVLAVGRPPDELLSRVRHRGQRHSGLEGFKTARRQRQRRDREA